MGLSDPLRSYAVLIGSSHFDDPGLDDLPAVANNLARLGDLLEDPTVWGLPADHCVRLPEPTSQVQVLNAIRDAADRAESGLLVYYAGHGLRDPHLGDLLLSLSSTIRERPYTAVEFDKVRREVAAKHHLNRMVLLDCCYSGAAMAGGMSGPSEIADETAIPGTYLLTASAATRPALAPPGEEYTAFTGELIRLLEDGLSDAGDLIEVGRVYEHLYGQLRRKGRPLPQQRLGNGGPGLAFARNRHPRGPVEPEAPGTQSPVGPPPAGWEAVSSPFQAEPIPDVPGLAVREAPVLGSPVVSLPDAPGPAVQEPPTSRSQVGPPPDAWGVQPLDLVPLHLLGFPEAPAWASRDLPPPVPMPPGPPPVPDTLATTLRGKPRVIAGYAARLRAAGDDRLADELLDRAAELRPAQEVATLIRLLHTTGSPGQATLVCARVARRDAQTIVACGEALRAMDDAREDLDLLFAAVAYRSDDDVAEILQALTASEIPGETGELLQAVVIRRTTPEALLDLLHSLRRAQLDRHADLVLTGPHVHDGTAVRLADLLLGAGREQEACDLYVRAGDEVVRLPAAELIRVLGVLDDHSHGNHADQLFRSAVDAADPRVTAELCAAALHADMPGRAAGTLLRAAEEFTPDAIVALADELRDVDYDEGVLTLLRAAAWAHPGEPTAQFVDALWEMGRPVDANRLLAEVAGGPAKDAALLMQAFDCLGRARDRNRLMSAFNRQDVPARLALFVELLVHDLAYDGLDAPLEGVFGGVLDTLLRALSAARNPRALVTFMTGLVEVGQPPPMWEGSLEWAIQWILLPSLAISHKRRRTREVTAVRHLVAAPAIPIADRVYAMAALSAVGREAEVKAALSEIPYALTDEEALDHLEAMRGKVPPACGEALIRSFVNNRPKSHTINLVKALLDRNLHGDVALVREAVFAEGDRYRDLLYLFPPPLPPAPESAPEPLPPWLVPSTLAEWHGRPVPPTAPDPGPADPPHSP